MGLLKKTETHTLEFSEKERRWLRAYLQNAIREETKEEEELRHSFFDALTVDSERTFIAKGFQEWDDIPY